MKINVVTIIDNTNYGTYLQALATCKLLDKENDVILLNYEREKCSPISSLKRRIKKNNKIRLWDILSQLIIIPAKRKFLCNEISRYIKLSKKITKNKVSEKNIPDADIYLTGSDQVWNTEYNEGIDTFFYLGFVPSGRKKVCYAASIGQDTIDSKYIPEIKDLLLDYSKITLREKKSISLLNSIGINNVENVLDPTLLITKENWAELFKIKKECKEQYILVYSVEVDKTKKLIELANKLAKKNNLKVYLIENGNPFKHYNRVVDKVYYSPSLKKFIELFYNSQFIIASSFHGTAFSINFNKPFFVLLPNKYNIRINSLLEDFGLQNRAILESELNNINSFDSSIDYVNVCNKLNIERERSNRILNAMVSE